MKTKLSLTANDVALIVAACKLEAEANGWIVSVAVVDDGGRVMTLIRFDGAGYGSPDVALKKAQTSAMSRKPSLVAEKATTDRLPMLAIHERLPLQGALPIIVGGECVGAVGVSGATSPQDEQIAQAGINALLAEHTRSVAT